MEDPVITKLREDFNKIIEKAAKEMNKTEEEVMIDFVEGLTYDDETTTS